MANQSNTSRIDPFASYFVRPFNRNNGAYDEKQDRNKRNANGSLKISVNKQCVEQYGPCGYWLFKHHENGHCVGRLVEPEYL